MPTQCSADLFGFGTIAGRAVVAGFDGGQVSSDAGALLLGATDRAIGLVERFAACFQDGRAAQLVEHQVPILVGQRVFGIALGYEDLIDHDHLRHDPIFAVLAGKLAAFNPYRLHMEQIRSELLSLIGSSSAERGETGA